jgi:hypothetical protein
MRRLKPIERQLFLERSRDEVSLLVYEVDCLIVPVSIAGKEFAGIRPVATEQPGVASRTDFLHGRTDCLRIRFSSVSHPRNVRSVIAISSRS